MLVENGIVLNLRVAYAIYILPSMFCGLYCIVFFAYLRELIAQLKEQNADAMTISKAKSTFLSTIGHEIRYIYLFQLLLFTCQMSILLLLFIFSIST